MPGLYIASTTPRAGKSLLTFSLGVLLQKAGRSVGYMKPLGNIPQKKEELLGDADALVIQEVLGQDVPADVLTPVMLPQNLHTLAIQDRPQYSLQRIAQCYDQIATGKDLMLVAGTGAFPATGRVANAEGISLVRALDLKVILVEQCSPRFGFDEILFVKDMLGPSLLGLVLNNVPDQKRRDVHKILVPWLLENGIAVLGVIGHEPGLKGMRVSDLAIGLEGRVVAAGLHASRAVSGFLIGTMQVDNFMLRMRRHEDCAVIVGGDRSDLQLAALHARVPCVILTGNLAPTELIRSKAEESGVTLVVVKDDTYTVARQMSRILNSKKLHDLAQIRLGVDLVGQSLDCKSLLKLLD